MPPDGARSTSSSSSTPTARLSQITAHVSAAAAPPSDEPVATTTQPAAAAAPSVIAIFGWTAAPRSALQRYATQYGDRFPAAAVLLFPVTFTDFLPWPQRTARWSRRGLDELVAAIEAASSTNILVHIFSGGGAARFGVMASRYRQHTGRPLPVQMLVCDSAPTDAGIRRRARTLNDGIVFARSPWLVKELTRPVFIVGLTTASVWSVATCQDEPTQKGWECLLDPLLVPDRATRCYIYSLQDPIVHPDEVQRHIQCARDRGMDVFTEQYADSTHVGHARKDPQRYWGLIERAWKKSGETTCN